MSDELRRKNDVEIAILNQRLDDFINLSNREAEMCRSGLVEKLRAHDEELASIKKIIRVVELPARIIGWSVILAIMGLVGYLIKMRPAIGKLFE